MDLEQLTMAKYNVIYSCGHPGTMQVFGSESKNNNFGFTRQERADYAASNRICRNCWNESQKKKSKNEVLSHVRCIEDFIISAQGPEEDKAFATASMQWLKNYLKLKGFIA